MERKREGGIRRGNGSDGEEVDIHCKKLVLSIRNSISQSGSQPGCLVLRQLVDFLQGRMDCLVFWGGGGGFT